MSLEYPYDLLGSSIRERRKAIDLTQQQLAEKMGISRGSLANIETGKQRILVHQVYQFANALETDVFVLLPKMTGIDSRSEKTDLPIPEGTPEKFSGDILKIFG